MQYTWLFIWAFAAIVLIFVEAVSVSLVSIWFALGAFAAFVTAIFTDQVWLQLVVFAVVSGLALALTRPFVKRFLNAKKTATNADSLIGRECVVVEMVGANAPGRVRQGDVYWTALAEKPEECFIPGERAVIASIGGNQLAIRKCQGEKTE